ncbi:von Willebrand factor type A domain-containing protein [Pedobacter panaciterrae]|uniref:YfbK domain-containing protein n=1 Tax=Pedobacter panaciterrae TaxID=363849 RepID=UPI00155DB494|nr:von Willebrand factor type A domain-containing protein [Pedobacter panaciterrae]NQX55031.1 von Willebrand factor type A domain-containing protein [Pedobacter panaciterrae]
MKKLLLPIFIVLLFTAFKAPRNSVRTIRGIVTDRNDKTPLAGVDVFSHDKRISASTNKNGFYTISVPENEQTLTFEYIGYKPLTLKINGTVLNVKLEKESISLKEEVIVGYGQKAMAAPGLRGAVHIRGISQSTVVMNSLPVTESSESYASINENRFRDAIKNPLSTFSIDVDAASYTNIRRFINNGALPPADAVRIEEMVNYFDYDYPQPKGKDPINIVTEIADAPWNTMHKLVKIGLQGRKISTEKLPASNLVFLIDVSGSMAQVNKLPLLVSSFKLLAEQLRSSDKVAIVVYAGNAGLVLPSTPGNQKIKIKDALDKLSAGGSTAGGQGIELAYKVASENFIKGGNNRVILATDGDFNVGASSDDDMEKLIEKKRKSGIFLTTLGYGMGNYKDSKMEVLANKGNGNYAYIDNITEARKVLVNEFGGTLFTIAKDVKLQIEFNPSKVQSYRLIGYENRMLKAKDFNDDQKDAGELGSGHTVTALYEVIPVGIKSTFSGSIDDLKYQSNNKPVVLGNSKELLTVKLRYKQPDGNVSKLIEQPVIDNRIAFDKTTNNFRFSAAVAEFGMLLRQSDFRQNSSFDQVIRNAQKAMGNDNEGYRSEFIKLAKSAKLLAKDLLSLEDKTALNEKN